ncbi:AAA ATPase, central domain protein [Alkaliphilus metalliredigens QYMF]|uniref:AAA ATPase, central domain protein n=1 Tax=Alkaliphilus metalliredigens (strain QYMF) TaxID=293826 RepID=A6TQR8_ALKMQ|nr:ATP-binding protein [Alkaliphilus metalliredigens]ABR48536.1 AAA ATPase, central domain protein [Alkaliphilus metalliredigens QYMF]
MNTEIIKIIEGSLNNDKQKVISYAKVLANNLEQEGEVLVARKIRKMIGDKDIHPVYLDDLLSKPVDKESRMDILDVEVPSGNFQSLIFSYNLTKEIDQFIAMAKNKEKLYSFGIESPHSLLLYGVPGGGKTSIAKYISEKMELPLVTARLDSLISSLLGSTAKNIRRIFEFSSKQPCILFLDEFDAIAKARDDKHELGELKRVVNTLLQNIDEFNNNNILIAATNHPDLLDSAIWRRFSTVIEVPVPAENEINELIKRFLGNMMYDFQDNTKLFNNIQALLEGCSPADIKNICINCMKKTIINDKQQIEYQDLIYEIYLFKYHNISELESVVKFMNDNGVAQMKIHKAINLSLRQIRNILKK